jgi:lactoylglutathione lyase
MFKYVKFAELPVTDQDRAVSFYTEKVGLKVSQDAPYQNGWRWIELKVGDKDTNVLFSQRPNEDLSEIPSLNLIVEDVRGAYEKLKANGVVFTKEPSDAPWSPGNVFALFRDSENNTILIGNE